MKRAVQEALLDRVLPDWRSVPEVRGEHRLICPLHADSNPSLRLKSETLCWYCDPCGTGGGTWDLACAVMGEERAKQLVRELGKSSPPTPSYPVAKAGESASPAPKPPQYSVEDLGESTSAQRNRLVTSRRLKEGSDTLERLGVRRLSVRWYRDGSLGTASNWIGFPTLANGWKLSGLNRNGKPTLDGEGRLKVLNLGPVSLVVSPDLKEDGEGRTVGRLWDVEGESDLVAAVDAGLKYVVTATGGAASLAGHKRHSEYLRGLAPQEVVVIRDLDQAGRDGSQGAATWWMGQGIPVRVLELPEVLGEKGDLRDFLNGRPRTDGAEAVKPFGTVHDLFKLADGAELKQPRKEESTEAGDEKSKLEADLQALANLSPADYDHRREAAAKEHGIRVSTLDKLVKQHRITDTDGEGSGSAVLFPELERWSEPVEGAQLLTDLEEAFRRFLVLPEHGAVTMALWVLHAHAHAAACLSPLLAFVSPEKRCGKTTALDLLRRVVPRALAVANISPASLFRATERWQPTLIVDELDSFLKDNEPLRGILNSGHNRATANVIRTVGDDHEPKVFRTWSPKSVALIGSLPSTLEDRSIVISMKRRTKAEKVSRLRGDRDYEFPDLARRCARWVADHLQVLQEADPALPDSLHDRAADNWRCLAAIADLAGGAWPEQCREAAKALSLAEGEVSNRVLLLSDIRDVFEERELELWPSQELVDALVALKDRPWSEWGRGGKSLTTRGLAQLLKPLEIRSIRERISSIQMRGYRPEWFTDAFNRYIPPAQVAHPAQLNENGDLGDFTSGTRAESVPLEYTEKPNDSGDVPCVPHRIPPKGRKVEGGQPDGVEEGLL